jgi:uncharacterized DUF497 family protein
MRFEWDEAKNEINIRKHGIDFNDVVEMFNHPMLSQPDIGADYGEARWVGMGWLKGMVGVVVYVERYHDTIRVISARKATKHEVKGYDKAIKN